MRKTMLCSEVGDGMGGGWVGWVDNGMGGVARVE